TSFALTYFLSFFLLSVHVVLRQIQIFNSIPINPTEYIYSRAQTHARAHSYAHTHTHTNQSLCDSRNTHTHTHTHTLTHTHTYKYLCDSRNIPTDMLKYKKHFNCEFKDRKRVV